MTRPAPDASGALQGPAPAARIPALADRAGPRPAAGGLHIHGLVRHSELPNRRRRYMSNQPAVTEPARRKFLRGAAVATGAAALGFPMVARAQGPITMRWQSTRPQKDIFHEYALDFAKKVNDMTGGDLKIDVLPAGAVVPALRPLHAPAEGPLGGGPRGLVDHHGQQQALGPPGARPRHGPGPETTVVCRKDAPG